MKSIIALSALALSFVASPASAACGQNGDSFRLYLTEQVVWGDCDPYRFDVAPAYTEYNFPLQSAGAGCGPQVTPNVGACELDDTLVCEAPDYPDNAVVYITYDGVELVDEGEGFLTVTVEDEYSGIPCYIEYSVSVEEI